MAIVITFLVLLLLLLISIPIVNDYTAWGVEKRLCALPLPDKTQRVATISRADKIVGNGNGMQFFGAILIKSELTLEELDAYYAPYRKTKWDCTVSRQYSDVAGIELTTEYDKTLSFDFDVDYNGDDYYIVYSWGSSNYFLSDFDLRGH